MKKFFIITILAMMTSIVVQAQCGRFLNYENGFQAGMSIGINEIEYEENLHIYNATMAKYSGICYEYAAGFQEGYFSNRKQRSSTTYGTVNGDPADAEVCHAYGDPHTRKCVWE